MCVNVSYLRWMDGCRVDSYGVEAQAKEKSRDLFLLRNVDMNKQ